MTQNATAKKTMETLKAAPTVNIVPGEEQIPLISPVKPLTYEEADAKIRKGAESFSFAAANGRQGRVDVVSLGAKEPIEDRWDVGVSKGVDGQDTLFVGVYDGHGGGPETAEALGKNLIPCVAKAMAAAKASGDAPVSAEEAIQNSFVSLDNRILGAAEAAINAGHPAGTAAVRAAMAPAQTGSCALLAVYEAGSASLYIALAGDSRAVRGQSSSETDKLVVDVLTEDQNACNEQEYARVAAEHPGEESVILNTDRGTVLGLGMSRAFGNANSKWSNELLQKAQTNCHGPRPVSISKTPPYITASPVVTTRVVEAQDFVILGSDGLWEQISHEHAVECVSRWRAARRAGKPEAVVESGESRYTVNEDGSLYHVAQPEDFAIEDLDNAAVCLIKNVLGGRHRYMVAGAVTATTPIRRMVRDDLTAQVIFFEDP